MFDFAKYFEINFHDKNPEGLGGLFGRFFDTDKKDYESALRFIHSCLWLHKPKLEAIRQSFFEATKAYLAQLELNEKNPSEEIRLLEEVVREYNNYKLIIETTISTNLDYQSIDKSIRKKITKNLSQKENNDDIAKKKLVSRLADSYMTFDFFPTRAPLGIFESSTLYLFFLQINAYLIPIINKTKTSEEVNIQIKDLLQGIPKLLSDQKPLYLANHFNVLNFFDAVKSRAEKFSVDEGSVFHEIDDRIDNFKDILSQITEPCNTKGIKLFFGNIVNIETPKNKKKKDLIVHDDVIEQYKKFTSQYSSYSTLAIIRYETPGTAAHFFLIWKARRAKRHIIFDSVPEKNFTQETVGMLGKKQCLVNTISVQKKGEHNCKELITQAALIVINNPKFTADEIAEKIINPPKSESKVPETKNTVANRRQENPNLAPKSQQSRGNRVPQADTTKKTVVKQKPVKGKPPETRKPADGQLVIVPKTPMKFTSDQLAMWKFLGIAPQMHNNIKELYVALIDVLYACEQQSKDVLHEKLYELYHNYRTEFNKVMGDILEVPLTFGDLDKKENSNKFVLWGNISLIWKKISGIFKTGQDYGNGKSKFLLSAKLAERLGIKQEDTNSPQQISSAISPLLLQYMSAAPFFVGQNETQVFKDLYYLCSIHPDLTQAEVLDNSRLSEFKTFDDYLDSLPADQIKRIKQYYKENQRSRKFFKFIFKINSLTLNKVQFDAAIDVDFPEKRESTKECFYNDLKFFFKEARDEFENLQKSNKKIQSSYRINVETDSDEERVYDNVASTTREMFSPQAFLKFLQDESQIVTNSKILEALFKLGQENFNVDFSKLDIGIIFYRLSLFKSANLVMDKKIEHVLEQIFTAITNKFISNNLVFDDKKFAEIAKVQMKNYLGNENACTPDRLWVEMLKGLDKKERELAESKKAAQDCYFIGKKRVERKDFSQALITSEKRDKFKHYSVNPNINVDRIKLISDLQEKDWQQYQCNFRYTSKGKFVAYDVTNSNNDIIKHQQQLQNAIQKIKEHIAELNKAIINKQIAVFKCEALESLNKKLTYAMSNPGEKVEDVVSQWKKQKTTVRETESGSILTNAEILGIHRKPTWKTTTDSEIVIDSLAYPKITGYS